MCRPVAFIDLLELLIYRYHGNPYAWKDDLYIERGLDIQM